LLVSALALSGPSLPSVRAEITPESDLPDEGMRECIERILTTDVTAPDPAAHDAPKFLQALADTTTTEKVLDSLRVVDPGERFRNRYVENDPITRTLKIYLGPRSDPATRVIQVGSEAIAGEPSATLQGTGLIGQEIVLDAGHMRGPFGRPYAPEEGKFVEYTPGVGGVSEARINFGVMSIVGRRLEEAGARVIFTVGDEPIEADFPRGTHRLLGDGAWVIRIRTKADPKENPRWRRVVDYFRDPDSALKYGAALRGRVRQDAFEIYQAFDLSRRACVGWAERSTGKPKLQPRRIYVSIHHDADAPRNARGDRLFTRANGVSVHVPGVYHPKYLNDPFEAFDTARIALQGSAEDSLLLAKTLSRALQRSQNLGVLTRGQLPGPRRKPGRYLLDPEDAIYARAELKILREMGGPVVLTEGFYFNNIDEFTLLLANDLIVQAWGPFRDHVYPKRIQSYADGLFDGLAAFFDGPQLVPPPAPEPQAVLE
jgi:hypothetical protein